MSKCTVKTALNCTKKRNRKTVLTFHSLSVIIIVLPITVTDNKSQADYLLLIGDKNKRRRNHMKAHIRQTDKEGTQ